MVVGPFEEEEEGTEYNQQRSEGGVYPGIASDVVKVEGPATQVVSGLSTRGTWETPGP